MWGGVAVRAENKGGYKGWRSGKGVCLGCQFCHCHLDTSVLGGNGINLWGFHLQQKAQGACSGEELTYPEFEIPLNVQPAWTLPSSHSVHLPARTQMSEPNVLRAGTCTVLTAWIFGECNSNCLFANFFL